MIVDHKASYKSQLSSSHGLHLDQISSTEKDPAASGFPGSGWFAVLSLAGSQHKVCKGDLMVLDRLKPEDVWAVGKEVEVDEESILLMGSKERTVVGLPNVKGGKVVVRVEEKTRDAKVVVFKKRRRKSSRRKQGFRAEKTVCRVLEVVWEGDEEE
ncbi:hypothetical protein TrRE_jg9112 [Triparma retinervis]|uniref:Large ribosomal subunit protein bL21m n=1 Tax=Triparma retinervis TaxID=2557542 RepID=A0A9W7AA13_9STRA|nr:hypothetical protein TrRE_jg9112 [Triparma retinervis]